MKTWKCNEGVNKMEELVDMREMTEQETIEAEKMAEIVFKLNHT